MFFFDLFFLCSWLFGSMNMEFWWVFFLFFYFNFSFNECLLTVCFYFRRLIYWVLVPVLASEYEETFN
jgi:hypothetical protein